MRVQKFPQRRRTRSPLIGSLAVAVAVVAAACSSGAGGSGGSGGSGGGKTTLKMITWENPPAVQAINKIDKAFEKNPNITFKLQTAANVNGPYETLLQQTVNSGTADIVTSNFPSSRCRRRRHRRTSPRFSIR